MVVARFTMQRYETSNHSVWEPDGKGGHRPTGKKEMRTLILAPVYSNDPDDPNKQFWDATPSGEIRLGTVNPSAWQYFELDATYEVTFKKVDPAHAE